ncbi:MAG: hypothetical protein WC310_03300 [Patescibacteria group bacterium]|jgi:hypothetical protein
MASNKNVFISPDENGKLTIVFAFNDITQFTKFVQIFTETGINFTVENSGKEKFIHVPAEFTEEDSPLFEKVIKTFNLAKKTGNTLKDRGDRAINLAEKILGGAENFINHALEKNSRRR